MNSKEYINVILDRLHKEFPSFTFRYQYDSIDDSHVIEYSPYDLIEGDPDFEDRKYAILDNYFNNNYTESLVFITEFDPVGISEPEKIYEGHFNYTPKYDVPQIVQPSLVNWQEILYLEDVDFSLAA